MLPDEWPNSRPPCSTAAIVVIIVDNGMYGTIRMHQNASTLAASATQCAIPTSPPTPVRLGHGERVESTEEFGAAFDRALASGLPAIVHCLIDPEAISPSSTLTQVRDAAIAAGR